MRFNIINKHNIVTSLKTKDELSIGVFIGLWIGDGSKFIDRGSYIIKFHFHKDNILLDNFIKKLLHSLFGINARTYYDGGNKASIKISSKFIYYFIENYVDYGKNKTLTVSLKKNHLLYSKQFLHGLLLGLALSDGSISGGHFTYATISNKLANNVKSLLLVFNYNKIRHYVHDRQKYGWHDLNLIHLSKGESVGLINNFNFLLQKLGCDKPFSALK